MLQRGQRHRAQQYFAKAADLDPEYPAPFTALAYLKHLNGGPSAGKEVLDRLREKAGEDLRFREAYGLALLATGREEDAREVLESFADAAEPHVKALLALALLRAQDGAVESAERLLGRLESWPVDGIPLEIDVTAYVDPSVEPQVRWGEPERILLRLLELNGSTRGAESHPHTKG